MEEEHYNNPEMEAEHLVAREISAGANISARFAGSQLMTIRDLLAASANELLIERKMQRRHRLVRYEELRRIANFLYDKLYSFDRCGDKLYCSTCRSETLKEKTP